MPIYSGKFNREKTRIPMKK